MMKMAKAQFSSQHLQLLLLVGYRRWTSCSYFRSPEVHKKIAVLKNLISSQQSMQLSLFLVRLRIGFGSLHLCQKIFPWTLATTCRIILNVGFLARLTLHRRVIPNPISIPKSIYPTPPMGSSVNYLPGKY